MSLGLPAHLASLVARRSFVSAQHVVALTLVSVSILWALAIQNDRTGAVIWPAAIALAPFGILLVLGRGRDAPLWSAGYLILGGLGAHLYALVLLGQVETAPGRDLSFLAVKIALILVGGVGRGAWAGLATTVTGYLVAEGAIGAAQLQAGRPLSFDPPSLITCLCILAVIPLVGSVSRRQLLVQPRLDRAARDDQMAALRYRVEVKAAALMHDTMLNHLAAIAEFDGERLGPALRREIENDVQTLLGENWLTEPGSLVDERARAGWQFSGLFTAIQESRLLGLVVETTGDVAAVGRLDRDSSIALGLAVKQCLVNVLKHSGATQAEVAVYGSDSAVSVMVVDTGRGFNEASTGADRLGLRTSVRKRIELVGGTVNVWSTPGRGTSIIIKIPAHPRDEAVAAGQGGAP